MLSPHWLIMSWMRSRKKANDREANEKMVLGALNFRRGLRVAR
jgi:hypothetical protein